jgi:DNA polymerase-3 subunit gamma/tau
MSYLVLARKYRSRNFSELVGQEHVVQALGNALQTQRLHHAYLFTGTRGVGKTTVSRILAKALNCIGPDGQGGITAEPCGVCQACRDIDAGRFVDYTELDAASNRGVDEVQSLLEQAVYKPVQGRFKVFMIDEVHMLTGHAFNAMLKTLEEPPEYLKFVLATTDPQKVPVTVLSRCLQFNLRPMAPDTVQAHLITVLGAEGITAEAGALRLIARAARGSMRDALSLTDQAIAFGNGQIGEETVRQMLGGVDRSHVLRLIDALSRADGREVVDIVDTLRTHGVSAAATLEDMAAVLQRMAVLQAVPQMAHAADGDDPEASETARLSRNLPPDETQLLYSLCLHGRGELGLAPDEYAALTMVLLRLLAFKPKGAVQPAALHSQEKKTLKTSEAPSAQPPIVVPQAKDVAERQASVAAISAPAPTASEAPPVVAPSTPPVDAPSVTPPWEDIPVGERQSDENTQSNPPLALSSESLPAANLVAIPVRQQRELDVRLQARPAEKSASVPSQAITPATLDAFTPTPEGDYWHGVVTALVSEQAITALVRELALQAQLVARDGPRWTLRVERESLNQQVARERLRLALETAGHAQALTVELGPVSDTPARRNALATLERQHRAEAILRDDPFVQRMVRDFGAKIVPGTLQVTPLAGA